MNKHITLFGLFIWLFLLTSSLKSIDVNAQNCPVANNLNTSNVSNFSVTLNWDFNSNVDYYRVRYKEVGTSSWSFEHNVISTSLDIDNLNSNTQYIWQLKSFCSSLGNSNSAWSIADTFTTANYPLDCYNTPNGNAFLDSCGNCVGGLTGDQPCIDFTPSVSIDLSTLQCDTTADIIFTFSQDANEPDIASSIFSSDAGSFDLVGLNTNDIIGTSVITAGGGYINVNTTLMVDFIINSDKISVKAVDDITGQIYGTFTIENFNDGVLVIASSLPDNNNVTNGNSQTININNLFLTPATAQVITFSSTINSELSDVDVQTSTQNILCLDCNGDLGGSAFIDSCGNCVGGNTGNVPCISFSPDVSVSLSNTNCDSLSSLTISVSQDANEPDMSTSLFVSNLGSFDIVNMNVGDVIGSAVMVAGNGANTFNTELIVTTIVAANQAVVQSQDVSTGIILGSFTISNSNPGVNVSAQTIPDGNNVTSGNSQTVTFNNVFVNPPAGNLIFTSTINSEVGDQDIQNFPFNIVCLCAPATSTTDVTECDSYTWNGTTYTTSGSYTYVTTNALGCDSTATLNLTINNSTLLVNDQTVCFGGSYSINGNTYSLSGSYSDTLITQNGCDSIIVTNLTVLNELIVSVNASNSGTACLGESVTLTMNGFASPNNTYQWSDANGVIVGAT
ncbi:MAG: fibronectin type III domain-containing protein, partial [Bacteroidota bacterium]|nr:fibronectin type III domain-containing protein [Bacteroidota bacterium]